MGLTVALFATLALAAQADVPQEAATWRAQADALYVQGDFRGALDAAEKARLLDPVDPWVRYTWIRALAAVDAEAARRSLPGLQDADALKALPVEDRARLETALGYLGLDLGIEPLAATHFARVPPSTASYPKAQAGLAILAVRRGNSRLALEHFGEARATVRQDPSLAELERDARYEVVLREFTTARDLRDANAAGRAYAVLDELRPNHPETLQARADLSQLRGDMPARERALRELLAVDAQAAGAAGQLVDTLLAMNRPYDAYVVAHDMAPERLASDAGLQDIERGWVSHLDAALAWNWRKGQTGHDRLDMPRVQMAWAGSRPRWGRFRLVGEAAYPQSDRVPAGEPFGTSPALAAPSGTQSDEGVGVIAQWAPRSGVALELGTTPSSFDVANLVGAVRFRIDSPEGRLNLGVDRGAIEDSLLSYAGTRDPLSGLAWGGVIRERFYLAGDFGGEDLSVYGQLSGAVFDGLRVDSNTEWRADAGFLARAASGDGWIARIGGAVEAAGFQANRSHFTMGHGGYFSPDKYLSVGPSLELLARNDDRSFHVECAVAWQEVRELGSDFFPEDPALQQASGDPRYPGDSRDGLGVRLAASVEWRVSSRTVAGVRLEGTSGEDAEQVRLQIYTRRWGRSISEPVQQPPMPFRGAGYYLLN